MGTKGVPFGYLEFSRAIRGTPCPHVRASGGGGRPGSGSGSVRFFLNQVSRVGLQRIVPTLPFGSEPNQRKADAVSVWNELLQRFRPNRCNCSVRFRPKYPSQSAINSSPLLSNRTHQLTLCVLKWDLLSPLSWSNFQREVGNRKATSKRFCKIRSERVLRKFNRFFSRIVFWIWDFRRRIFFYLPLQWVLLQSKDKYSPWNLSCWNLS